MATCIGTGRLNVKPSRSRDLLRALLAPTLTLPQRSWGRVIAACDRLRRAASSRLLGHVPVSHVGTLTTLALVLLLDGGELVGGEGRALGKLQVQVVELR